MSELRQNILTGDWVVIATERAKRPHSYSRETKAQTAQTVLGCPFCPGNESDTPPEVFAIRGEGEADTTGWSVRVVPNKFPAFSADAPVPPPADSLHKVLQGFGRHEVIIHGPDHNLSLARMPVGGVARVLSVYRSRLRELGADEKIAGAVIIVNHGREAGASIDHPHSQLFATPVVAPTVAREIDNIKLYMEENGRCLVCDMAAEAVKEGRRMVAHSDRFVAFAPYAARVPFEVYIVPKDHEADFSAAGDDILKEAAGLLKRVLGQVDDRLGDTPYNIYLHTRPFRSEEPYHWHMALLPKTSILAGFEFGAGIMINVVEPATAADFLR